MELTTFVGREAEVEEVRRILAGSRLLTLTGAGGSGKTRLALHAVQGPGGPAVYRDVAWAPLATADDPADLPALVADAFGVPEEARGGTVDALVSLLHGRRALLVLDNCEHLVEACADLVHALLRGCPELGVLATSREALGVPGERAWLVPPLGVPSAGEGAHGAADGASSDPAASEAVRLFVERAADVAPAFRLTAENAAAVADVCRRLDGIPLAIELAAARVRHLSPEQIRGRLDDAFRLLNAGGRARPPRHRTLLATMDWSHDLLPEDARVLFRRLAVFRGGFSLDGVEAVGAGGALDAADVLDVLARLVDRSLVTVEERGGTARYALLEIVRQYATRRLEASGEMEEVRSRHARHVAAAVAEAEPSLVRPERPAWLARLLPEIENVRDALAWTRRYDPALHVKTVGMLWWFWYSTRHWTEAGRWMADALALPEAEAPGRERAALLFGAGALAALQSRVDAARPALEEAAAMAAARGDARLEAYALNYLGLTYAGEGRSEARGLCERAEAWFRANGDDYGLRLALLLLGTVAASEGRMEDALALNGEGVAVARRFGQPRELAVALQNLAAVYLRRGEPGRAAPLIREGLELSREDPSYFFVAVGLDYLAEGVGAAGRPLDAARIVGAASAVRERIGACRFALDQARLDEALAAWREAAGDAAFRRAWEAGAALTLDEVLEEVLDGGVAREEATGTPAGGEEREGATAAPDLVIRALGPFEVEVAGQPVPFERWSYAKPRELLVWLARHATGGTRDDAARALWPDAAPSQLKNSFHVTLHHLRRALGRPDWVVLDAGRYRLAAGLAVEWDGGRFEAAARALLRASPDGGASSVELRGVLDLYRGDLLEGDPGGAWLQDARDGLRRLHAELTLAYGEALEREGADAEAADVYNALALRDDLNEEAHRRAMACWARAGDRRRALRHYERVVALLRDAVGAEPEPATVALYDRIRAPG